MIRNNKLKQQESGKGKSLPLLLQMAGFGLVGAGNTLISYVTYAITVAVGGHYLVGCVLGFVLSVFHGWLWQYFAIFREGGVDCNTPWWQSLFKTYCTYAATGLVLNPFLLFVLLDVVHFENLIALIIQSWPFFMFEDARACAVYCGPLILLIITIPLNFVMNKFWAFRKEK